MSLEIIQKGFDNIEAKLAEFSDKAEAEVKAVGKVAHDTQTAIDALGIKQRELADRLLQIEQKGVAQGEQETKVSTWGEQFTKSDVYKAFAGGNTQKARFEVKNTLTGADATVAPDRKPGIVSGAFLPLTLEAFLPSMATSSNAIEFTKEASFTNSAAEVAEGVAKAESALTWSLVNMPVSTVAHWIKISRQLAADNAALAAYVDTRMRYGVNAKVETQLVVGDGTAPNISGILDSGNFTAHGIADAAPRRIAQEAGPDPQDHGRPPGPPAIPADAILLNPADWATIEIDLLTTAAGQTLYSVTEGGQARLFGVPVIQSIGMTADNVAVGAFAQAYMIHNREGVVVEMSDSDSDNFTKNLITIRAERRLALATERPAAVRAGDLTPA